MYNTRSSLVVTDPATTQALKWLSIGDQTGSRFVTWLWSYMLVSCRILLINEGLMCGRDARPEDATKVSDWVATRGAVLISEARKVEIDSSEKLS